MFVLLISAVLTAAPADTTIRAGIYDLEISYGGSNLAGALTLTPAPQGFTAVIEVGPHSPAVKTVVRKAAHLTITVATPEGAPVVYQLDFDGDRVTGTFELAGVPGKVTGARR